MTACSSNFNVKQLAKGDIDFVADSHRHESERLLFELMDKLYKRNPKQLQKQGQASIEAQTKRLMDAIKPKTPLLIDGLEGAKLLTQGFDPDFDGDRVFTLIGGLLSMLHKSYGYHTEFFLFDQLDEEKLRKSARNFEVFSWRLRNSRNTTGELLLLSNELSGEQVNLSFERLIAKLISMQDMMSLIAADGDERTLRGVAQGVAKAVFLPI